jgi:hypothetical protein
MFRYCNNRVMQALVILGLITESSFSQASPGSDIATMMQYWYRLTARDCGSGRLASECSGIILRGVDSKEAFRVWNAGPNSHNADAGGNGIVSNGGVSASYLRADAEYDGLGLLKYNGFALTPNDFINEKTQFKITVLCAFPIDAWTGNRTNKGCGDYMESGNTFGVKEDYCQKLSISNAKAWLGYYDRQTSDPDAMKAHKFQCGFDTTNDYFGTYNKADAFNTFIEARKALASDPQETVDAQTTQTELRLETWPDDNYWNRDWNLKRPNFDSPLPEDSDPAKVANRTFKELPIAAFIYIGGIDFVDTGAQSFAGRTLAQDDQRRWNEEIPSGKGSWKPVIKVQLPRTLSEDARFAYYPGDQLVAPPADYRSCDKYIEKVEWTDDYQEPVLGIISSLKVTPTECGRKAGVGKTDVVFAELANLAANDKNREWNFDHLGSSMRRQLACHLDSPDIAMNKPTWSLEPARPYVAHDVIMKLEGDNKCNPH